MLDWCFFLIDTCCDLTDESFLLKVLSHSLAPLSFPPCNSLPDSHHIYILIHKYVLSSLHCLLHNSPSFPQTFPLRQLSDHNCSLSWLCFYHAHHSVCSIAGLQEILLCDSELDCNLSGVLGAKVNKSQISSLSIVTSGTEKSRKEREEGEVSVEGGSTPGWPCAHSSLYRWKQKGYSGWPGQRLILKGSTKLEFWTSQSMCCQVYFSDYLCSLTVRGFDKQQVWNMLGVDYSIE